MNRSCGCVDGIAAVIEIDFKGLYQFSTVFKIIVQQRFEPLCQRQLGKRGVVQEFIEYVACSSLCVPPVS